MVIRRWPGRPGRARHSTPMISLDCLVCRAYGAQALNRRLLKIHRSQSACRQHQRRRCSLRIIGMLWTATSCRRRQRWLCGNANVPQVPQVHQSCVRTENSAVFHDLSTTITAFKSWTPSRGCLRFKCSSTVSVLLTAPVDGVAGFRRLVAGGPSAGREFSDSIDRKISQAREHRAEVVADR